MTEQRAANPTGPRPTTALRVCEDHLAERDSARRLPPVRSVAASNHTAAVALLAEQAPARALGPVLPSNEPGVSPGVGLSTALSSMRVSGSISAGTRIRHEHNGSRQRSAPIRSEGAGCPEVRAREGPGRRTRGQSQSRSRWWTTVLSVHASRGHGGAAALVLATQEFVANGGRRPSCRRRRSAGSPGRTGSLGRVGQRGCWRSAAGASARLDGAAETSASRLLGSRRRAGRFAPRECTSVSGRSRLV
jgi:hypothetical protein